MRVAGAQIPVSTSIQKNKQEILKAIDWAKENEVDHLLTPEGSLSGWCSGWQNRVDELNEALREVEKAQIESGIFLHLGTCYEENEEIGIINRNQIRHYHRKGYIQGVTNKTFVVNGENCLGRDPVRDPVSLIEIDNLSCIAGLLCNDLWGHHEQGSRPLTTLYATVPELSLIVHATNGAKVPDDDPSFVPFDAWHNGFLHMTAYSCGIPILTVDACTPWDWDGEDESMIDKFRTSSQSGVITKDGWLTDVPRYGRQYFYCDIKLPKRHLQKA